MKFSHLLSEFLSIDGKDHQEQAHPDFVSYKKLKKCLNKAVEEQKVWMEEYYRRQEALKKIPPRKPSPKEVEDEDTNADATTNDTRKVQTNEDIGRCNHQKKLKDREIAQPGNAIREETVIPPITEGEKEFAAILKSDVEAINRYFIEKEEDAVMRLHALNDRRVSAWTDGANAARIMQEFANFHGEMVLLLHWSMMNYAGVLKIIKKRDKLLGKRNQKDILNRILNQPFTSTDRISRLVKQAEEAVRTLTSSANIQSNSWESVFGDEETKCDAIGEETFKKQIVEQETLKSDILEGERKEGKLVNKLGREDMEDHKCLLKKTRAALGMLAKLQTTAHTPSTLLPIEFDRKRHIEIGEQASDLDSSTVKRSRNVEVVGDD